MPRKLSTSDFIAKAIEVHGDKYDYSKSVYMGWNKPITITCKVHGDFVQSSANTHLTGKGCQKCGRGRRASATRLTTKQFVERAKRIHGDAYDYSQSNYTGRTEPIDIICKKHGVFTQASANNHLAGSGCPKCGAERWVLANSSTREKFIEKAKKVHGDKYDYSKSKYTRLRDPIEIICKTHGSFIQSSAKSHLSGSGCPKCVSEKRKRIKLLSVTEFKEAAKTIHGDKYKYNKFTYVNTRTKTRVTCNLHGDFWVTPNNHISKQSGCPKCVHPLREQTSLKDYLSDINHSLTIETGVRGLLKNKLLEIDLYIEDLKLGFEWNGYPWHYESSRNLSLQANNASLNGSAFRKKHHEKAIQAKNAGIRLIQIFHDQWENTRTRPILESIIRLALGKPDKILHARKCEIGAISNKEAIRFLKTNHIQNIANADISYGLKYNGTLVSVMTFVNRNRYHRDEEISWEILRYAPMLNTAIVGSHNRLFNAFLEENKPNKVISYTDLSLFNTTGIWTNLGFREVGTSPPAFWPIDRGLNRRHRSSFTKPRLMKKFGDLIDPNKSQIENILSLNDHFPFGVVWDAGSSKFVWVQENGLT